MQELREVKVRHLEARLKLWLNDAPLRQDGLFWNSRQMAERIVDELTKIEEEAYVRRQEQYAELNCIEQYQDKYHGSLLS